MRTHDILDKGFAGARLTAEDGLALLQDAELLELSAPANWMRERFNPPDRITYAVDTNLNYTTLCDAYCSFCAGANDLDGTIGT